MNSKLFEWLALPAAFMLQDRGLNLSGQSGGSSWWDWERLAMQIVFIGLLIRIAIRLGALIGQAQTDREAREIAIDHLTKTASELAAKTEEIAKAKAIVDLNADARMGDRFDSIDQGIEKNTDLTRKAADASAEAAQVANEVNQKIADTNKRLLEHVEHGEGKP